MITGIVGRLGRRLAPQLHRARRVIGLDRGPFLDRPKDIEHDQIDRHRKRTRDTFRSSNYLRLPVVPTLLGFDPMMHVVHEDDVVRAIELALEPGERGIFAGMRAPVAALIGALIAAGCGGARHRRVQGPPPEYEPAAPALEASPLGARDGAPDILPAPDAGPQ